MNVFTLLLVAASIAYGLARLIRLPTLPVLIISGMALNFFGLLPSGFGLVTVEESHDHHVSGAMRLLEFGLVFLVFSSGVELNPQRFSKHRAAVLWIGGIQFGISALIGFASAHWLLGFGWLESIYLGVGLAVSSTLVVLRQLRMRQAMFEPFGRVVTGVLLIQDAALVVAIVLLLRIDRGIAEIGLGLGATLLIGSIAWLTQRSIIPSLIKRMKPDEESLLLWLIAVLFCFVGLASLLQLPPIIGAFFGGFAFSAFPLNGLVRGQLSSLSDFFQALFFVTLGALVGIPEPSQWLLAGQLSLVVLLVTPPLVAALAEWRGLNARASIESGLLLAQISEFSLLLGLSGLIVGHLSVDGFVVLALATVMTMALTPFLSQAKVARSLLRFHPFRRWGVSPETPENHVLILGLGSAGMWTVKPLIESGQRVVVVDDDAIVCRELAKREIEVIRGDASEPEILRRAGAAHAKTIIASMRRVEDAKTVLRIANQIPVFVRVFEAYEAEIVEQYGGIPIKTSDVAAETFLAWLSANDRISLESLSQPSQELQER